MSYKPGTRVKKVRGDTNIGVTGIVVPIDPRKICVNGGECGMHIKADQGWLTVRGTRTAPGTVGCVHLGDLYAWEPIVPDGHKPCETGFSLDDFLKQHSSEKRPS